MLPGVIPDSDGVQADLLGRPWAHQPFPPVPKVLGAHRAGITNIMALRGDAPAGQQQFQQTAGGFRYANELVRLIRSEFPDLGVGVAGYPEKHPEAPSPDGTSDTPTE